MFQTKNYICRMKEELKTVFNYAKSKNVSTTWIYKLIKTGKLKCRIIDGVKFVVIN